MSDRVLRGTNYADVFRLEFGILAIPTQLICLLRSLVARAIADDAFEAGYRTAEEVLWPQHSLGDQDVQELPIKSDFQDKYITPISYTQYYELFLRTLLVAGLAERLRPYSLRVGAAGRLDGTPDLLFAGADANQSNPQVSSRTRLGTSSYHNLPMCSRRATSRTCCNRTW